MQFTHFITISGVFHTRMSHRVYTHAVVGRHVWQRDYDLAKKEHPYDRFYSDYRAELISGKHPQCHLPGAVDVISRLKHEGYTEDTEHNLQLTISERLTNLERSKTDGHYDESPIQWNESEASAKAGIMRFTESQSYTDLRIVFVEKRIVLTNA